MTENQPTKVRVDALKGVVERKIGTVNILDKAKAYYHTLITFLGAALATANYLLPFTAGLPAMDRGYISGAILFVTGLLNVLVKNETWIDEA